MEIKHNYAAREEKKLFGNCEDTLKLMSEKRIFNICHQVKNNTFIIYERCDEYFSTELSVHNCRQLSELFAKMADKLEENK